MDQIISSELPEELSDLFEEMLNCVKKDSNSNLALYSEVENYLEANDIDSDLLEAFVSKLEKSGIRVAKNITLSELEETSKPKDVELNERSSKPKSPRLSAKEEKELFAAYQNAEGENQKKLLEKIVETYLPLVGFVVRRSCYLYKVKKENVDDARQEASLALIEAIKKYDIKRRNLFSTYAVNVMFWRLRDAFCLNDVGGITSSMYRKRRSKAIYNYKEDFYNKNGRYPDIKEIAEHFKCRQTSVNDALTLEKAYLSLDFISGEGGIEPSSCDVYFANDGQEADDYIPEYYELLNIIFNTLSGNEITVMRMHLGLCEENRRYTDREIAAFLKLSAMRIGQIRRKSLEKLRDLAAKDQLYAASRRLPNIYLDRKRKPFITL